MPRWRPYHEDIAVNSPFASGFGEVLSQIARETEPFTIESDGLGIFTGPMPVLYVPIVRSPALSRVHQQVWQREELPA